MIRGWKPTDGHRAAFDRLIRETAGDLPLKADKVKIQEEQVVFVRSNGSGA
jgi:hypothetical protein